MTIVTTAGGTSFIASGGAMTWAGEGAVGAAVTGMTVGSRDPCLHPHTPPDIARDREAAAAVVVVVTVIHRQNFGVCATRPIGAAEGAVGVGAGRKCHRRHRNGCAAVGTMTTGTAGVDTAEAVGVVMTGRWIGSMTGRRRQGPMQVSLCLQKYEILRRGTPWFDIHFQYLPNKY